jgi:hypothetical protein
MKNGEFELDTMYEIWGRDEVIEVGPDRDGLDLIEVRVKAKQGSEWPIIARFVLLPEQAQLLAEALKRAAPSSS